MPQQEDTFTANDLQMSDSKHVQSIAADIQAESSPGPSAAELNRPLEKNRPDPEKNLHEKLSAKEPQAMPCEPARTRELANDWHDLIKRCNMTGLELQLAKHCALQSQDKDDRQIVFNLLIEAVHMHLLNDKIHQRIVEQLQELLGMTVVLNISQCQAQNELLTPQRREKLEAEARQQDAVDSILNDPKVALITDAYDAKVIEKTIKPV